MAELDGAASADERTQRAARACAENDIEPVYNTQHQTASARSRTGARMSCAGRGDRSCAPGYTVRPTFDSNDDEWISTTDESVEEVS